MRTIIVLSAVCCLSVVSAQWLEATIPVGNHPDALCYNSLNNKVYCVGGGVGSDVVTVVDGATNLVLAEIPVSGIEGCGLCYNPAADKIYCCYWNESYITVISGAGDSVITDIPMQVCHGYLACDSAGNKVYCAGDTGDLSIICGTGDSVLRVLHLGGEAPAVSIGYSPDHRKIYSGFDRWSDSDTVFVIDCRMDSSIASVPVYDWPSGLCNNPTTGRVYCRADYEFTMTVIDCATNQAIAWIDLGYGQSSACCAPPENKVFCTTYNGRFLVVDATTNTLVDSMVTGDFFHAAFYNQLNNKVYCASDSTVVIIDGATHQVLKTIAVGSYPTAFCHNPQQNRVYVANNNSASVSVIRDSCGGVEEVPSAEVRTPNAGATVVRGVLMMPGANGAGRKANGALLDALGRKVLDLHAGANDVSRFAPGVYFVREAQAQAQAQAQAVRKVVMTR